MIARSPIYLGEDILQPVKMFNNESDAAAYSAAHPNVLCSFPSDDTIIYYSIPRPVLLSDDLEYDGTEQSSIWENYDASKMSVSGTTAATNAGVYYARFTLLDGYVWSDLSSDDYTAVWEIAKIDGTSSADVNSISVDDTTPTADVVITRDGDGELSVSIADASIASYSINGTTVTFTGLATGSTTADITVLEGTNYNEMTPITISITSAVTPA